MKQDGAEPGVPAPSSDVSNIPSYPTVRRILGALTAAELESACSLLDTQVRNAMLSQVMHLPQAPIETNYFNLIRAKLTSRPHLADALSREVAGVLAEFTELFLGESLPDPSKEDIEDLTLALLYKYGFGPVALYYGHCIALGYRAAGLLLEHFAEDGLLCLDRQQGFGRPAAAAPAPKRKLRAERKRSKHKQQQHVPVRRARKKLNTTGPSVPAETVPEARQQAPVEPNYAGSYARLAGFPGMRHDHNLAGYIFWTNVEYAERSGSKTRPVVVVGVRDTTGAREVLVLPLYSNANKPAGYWRATEILDYQHASLTHGGFAGSTAFATALPESPTFSGRISPRDWNRLRIGEVN